MSWSKAIRQIHRWLSIAFTLGFLAVSVTMMRGEEPAEWLYFLPLIPLFALFGTGLYLFVLPYASRWRAARMREPSRAAR